MSNIVVHTQKPDKHSLPYWLITAVIACVIPLVTHVLLPALGIGIFEHRLGATTLPFLITLGLGGLLYTQYLRFSMRHPVVLAIYCAVFIQLIYYLSSVLESSGKPFPIRLVNIALLIVPTVLLLYKNFSYLNQNYNYFKYLVMFFSLLLLYFFVYNMNFIEPRVALVSSNTISQAKLHDYFYTFVGVVLVASSFQQVGQPEGKAKLFHRFNIFLIGFGLIHGLITLLGFPLNLFSMVLEGFRRTMGLYSHPNEFGKIQGLLLIYFIGLYYYYCRSETFQHLKVRSVLGVTIVINILTFLLSMSKNSFASFGIACALFFGISLFDVKLRRKILIPLVFFALLLILTLSGYQAYTGHDLISSISDRFNDTRSLRWRYSVWGYLLGNITWASIWIGHGLSASNMELYRFLFNTSKQSSEQSIFVHNAFINFLYDMGLSGMLIFSGFIAVGYQGLKSYFQTREPMLLCVVCLAVFLLICSMMDECITSLNDCLLFWLLTTLIYSYFVTRPASKLKTLGAPHES